MGCKLYAFWLALSLAVVLAACGGGGGGVQRQPLSVTIAGDGGGTVSSSPAGIDACSSDCSAEFDAGSQITLTAQPASGSVFAGWSGACTGGGTCALTMDGAKAVTATFNPEPEEPVSHSLTVTLSGDGSGTISSSPAGIADCADSCQTSFEAGTQVTLTATATEGSVFSAWDGCDGATDNQCTVAMTGDRAVSATFTVSPTDQCLPSITVNPGDDLAQSVADACEGATVTLAAGEHPLEATLELDKALTLVGAGRDNTRVVTSDGNRAIEYTGAGELVLRDLTFEYRGENRPILVRITSGSASVSDARFTGALAGLVFIGEAAGIVEGSRFDGNGYGVAFQGSSEVTVRDNVMEDNTNGINVEMQAAPLLEGNTVRNNTRDGVVFTDSAAGTARGNTVENNLQDGIVVIGEAQPLLEGNTVRNNARLGIRYRDSSGGTASDNTVEGHRAQGWGGIYLDGQARPTLNNNRVQNNFGGIIYKQNAGGIASNNHIEGNSDGISVGDQAAPTLEGNNLQGNERLGIGYFSSSSGVARTNTCSDNAVADIYIASTASPTLENNQCEVRRE